MEFKSSVDLEKRKYPGCVQDYFLFYTHTNIMLVLKIKEIRTKKGLTQKELSKLSGVSETYIGDLERNEKEPTISILCRIAKALEVDIKELFEYYD